MTAAASYTAEADSLERVDSPAFAPPGSIALRVLVDEFGAGIERGWTLIGAPEADPQPGDRVILRQPGRRFLARRVVARNDARTITTAALDGAGEPQRFAVDGVSLYAIVATLSPRFESIAAQPSDDARASELVRPEKAFASSAAKAAMAGAALQRIEEDGRQAFVVSRWNLSRRLDSLEEVEAWLERLGGRHAAR